MSPIQETFGTNPALVRNGARLREKGTAQNKLQPTRAPQQRKLYRKEMMQMFLKNKTAKITPATVFQLKMTRHCRRPAPPPILA